MIRRRNLLVRAGAGAGVGMLGGCGFHPLYLPEGGAGSPAAAELAAIYVPIMPDRVGQLMRQALQQRVDGAGTGVAKKYELLATLVVGGEGIGIQTDSSTTRIRLTANGNWTLRLLNIEHTVLTTGTSRITDGYNILNQQYFAADLEASAAYKRVVESLADQVVQQVAIFLKRRAAPAAA